jgi:hypothetical protein
MANNIAAIRNYTTILYRVYQCEATSTVLNSSARMARAERNAKEIMTPKISVTGLGDYTRNVGYKIGSITFDYETKTFNYDRGIELLADVMDVEEAGLLGCFVQAGAELQRTLVAPESDACAYSQIAEHDGVTVDEADLFAAEAVEVPQVRFYTKIDLLSDDSDQFGYDKASDGRAINFMVAEKSAIVKFDKHVASRVFSPDELEKLDSYMMKYRKYGIVELLDNKLAGVHVSAAPAA